MKDQFIRAIHEKKKVRLTFFSKEDNAILVRKCAPMDYGPKRKAKNQADRFHLWDYESDEKTHPLSPLPEDVREMVFLNEEFDPSEFVIWDTKLYPWKVPRDWGKYS